MTDNNEYNHARDLVLKHGRASASFLQREMVISYIAANRLIQRMEDAGIVSPMDERGRREITVQKIDHPGGSTEVRLGHNSAATDDRLRLLIERVELLEEEKKGIADDIRDVFAEAKAVGYDAKIMRQLVRLRKMQPGDRREMEALLDLYKAAVGLS